MTKYAWDPLQEIGDLSGKVIVVTGGTSGLGAACVEAFAKHSPAHIILTGRNKTAADKSIAAIREDEAVSAKVALTFVSCDLTSLAAVAVAAKEIRSLVDRIDIFLGNAGIMATQPGLTKDGYEIQFGTNHLGHALLVKLLLPTLLHTAEISKDRPRLVFTTSSGFAFHPLSGINFDTLKTTQRLSWPVLSFFGPWIRYGQSKLANILYAAELARRYPQLHSTAVHPGVIFTGLVDTLSMLNYLFVYITSLPVRITIDQGVKSQLWAAVHDEKEVVNGGFYVPVGVPGRHDAKSRSPELARKLWEWTENELVDYA